MIASSKKRKIPPVVAQKASKKRKIFGPLDQAKQRLNLIIKSHPDTRIYQIEEWNPFRRAVFRKFEEESFDRICENYINDSATYTNIAEYYFGFERCPLVFDIEWYNPSPTPRLDLFNAISDIVDVLVMFISIAIRRDDGVCITRDDVCVEQSCTPDGRKASFHVKVPKLIFHNFSFDMKSFVYYFCSWIYIKRDYLQKSFKNIPDIFFYHSPDAQKLVKEYIKNNTGINSNEIFEEMKRICEQQWRQGKVMEYASCGIDVGIYTNNRSLRIAGVCKPLESTNEIPRFLRPCLVTRWWANNLPEEYLAAEELESVVPSKEVRRAWARTSLLLLPAPPKPNIKVTPPEGNRWTKPQREPGIAVLPPASDENGDDLEWTWILDTEPFRIANAGSGSWLSRSTAANDNSLVYMDIDNIEVEDNENGDCFIYVLDNGNVTKFERQNGRWKNSTARSNLVREDIKTLKACSYSRVNDKFTQYWNVRVGMRRDAKRHMEGCGYHDETQEEDDGENTYKREYISILHLTDFTQPLLFSASNVTLDPRFKVVTARKEFVSIKDIKSKTPIFCPKHEIDDKFYTHHPSAYIDIDDFGRHYIRCSGGCPGSINVTWQDTMNNETWVDLQQKYGNECVRFITEDNIELKHLLRLQIIPTASTASQNNSSNNKDNEVISEHCGGWPEVNIIISPMGSGKTTMLNDLVIGRVHLIKKKLGLHALQAPSILAISPRRDLAKFMARKFGLACYFEDESLATQWNRIYPNTPIPDSKNKLLCALPWLTICINSLGRLEGRQEEGYDIIILDEFATTALSLLAEHMHKYVKRIMNILRTLMKNSKMVILLAADGTPKMARLLLPFMDWENPSNLHIVINNGGTGGVNDHDLYVSDDLGQVCQVLKMYVQQGLSVYVPTNQRKFAWRLRKFCEESLNLADDEILVYDKNSPRKLKKELINTPEKRLGYKQRADRGYEPDPLLPKVRVFIATPAFGVGFSIAGGVFDITIAFFFLYPQTVPGNVQHIARVRGNDQKTIICFYQSLLSRATTYKPHLKRDQAQIENAVRSYEELMASVNPQEFNKVPEGEIRSFAIAQEVEARLSKLYGDMMFITTAMISTRTTPLSVESWICNKGIGPIKTLPAISKQELQCIRGEKGDEPPEFTVDPPLTWTEMEILWLKQSRNKDLGPGEDIFLEHFDELPVPFGLLEDYERSETYIEHLDHIWRVMEVITHGTENTLLEMDYTRYTESEAISLIPQGERFYQQYQLFEVWSRLVLPSIPDDYQFRFAKSPGRSLMLSIINLWQLSGKMDDFYFHISPHREIILDVIDKVNDELFSLDENDADTGKWILSMGLDELDKLPKKKFRAVYAKAIRQGFRQLFGKNNVRVVSRKDNLVRIKILNFKRIIWLACIRRINLECPFVIQFRRDKFSIISAYRNCAHLRELIPSDEELAQMCGIDL